MNVPLVSIIVPCFNQAHFLSYTLISVINQTYENWECIIVNDGSPDNTNEVAQKFIQKDKRFILLEQNNQGLAMARNNGIKKSHGEYILPLDSDDLIEPTYIEKAINYYRENPDTKLVYCEADRFDQKREYWNLPKYKYEEEIWANCIFCSAIYKRTDYDKTIGYNPNMKGGFEDWDFLLSFLKIDDKVYQIPEILFHYRYQKKSMLRSIGEKKEKLFQQLYLNHPDIYQEYIKNIVLYKNIIDNQERFLNYKSFVIIKVIDYLNRKIRNKFLFLKAKRKK